MAASRMTMAVSSATIGSLTSRSEGVLVNNASRGSSSSLGGVLGGLASRIKIVQLRKSVKNVSTTVVRAGELEDSIYNINLDYLTQNMPMSPPLPDFNTLPSSMPGYDRSSSTPSSYDSPQRSRPYESSAPPPVLEEGPKLYVGNLPWTCDSQQLAEIFQDFGNVELVEVIYDRETSRSRGFGFVTMGSQEEATAAKEQLDGYMLGGRALTVSFPQANRGGGRPPSERPLRDRPFGGGGGGGYDSENKLFVGNLSWSVDDESLRAKFSDYGKVLDARVIYDRETGRSRGFGFVTYSNADEVNDAIQNLDGADYDGRQIRVNLAGDKPPPRAREF